MNNKLNIPQSKIVELKKAFNELDVNRDGVISRDELKYMFQSTNIDFSDEDLDHFFKKHDTNADGNIQFEEFISAMLNGDLKV
jgi:Ca2+-binding EF-hand superfamily protein